MATVDAQRTTGPDDRILPTMVAPRDISSGTGLAGSGGEEVARSDANKELPDVHTQLPGNGKGAGGQPAGVRFRPGITDNESFPFNARPGATGPQPTNDLLNGGTGDGLRKSRTNEAISAASQERRSVQFAQETTAGTDDLGMPLRKTATRDTDDAKVPGPSAAKERQGSFFTKLKALASPAGSSHHAWGVSNGTVGPPHAAPGLQSERSEPSNLAEADGAADADMQEDLSKSADGVANINPQKPQNDERPALLTNDTAPNASRQSRLTSFMREHQLVSAVRPSVSRRATMSDINEIARDKDRAGISEDEGRDRVRAAWRRGIEGARNAARRHNTTDPDTPDIAVGKMRPGHIRRRTGIGIGGTDGADRSPFRVRADRQASTSAQKWRQVKAGLKMLGQRKRDEVARVDHQKSAQLMAELLAGSPAALILASMYQRDEYGHRKIPVLLEQLKIRIPSSEHRVDKSGDRHLIFRIELEYGNGPARMQWAIRRALQDFVNLHAKYKSAIAVDKVRHLRGDDKSKAKMPKFPKSTFPYARAARGLFEPLQDEEEEVDASALPDSTNNLDGVVVEQQRPGLVKHTRMRSSFAPPRRSSTGEILPAGTDISALTARQRDAYSERQRKKLETYLQQMIRWLIFRADSTRLCKFLELSALAIRLSAEGGMVGKQGLLRIVSQRTWGLRNVPSLVSSLERHTHKWFLVRHSYVVCVDGPESLNPFDVFLVDSDFRAEKKRRRIGDHSSAPEGLPNQDVTAQDQARQAAASAGQRGNHVIHLYNSERKLRLLARGERQWTQFQESINNMAAATIWAKKQRFGSFAPVRHNVWARWLVDGRDHMWQVSRAIDNAKDFVYIHDWWLSPELYMRRPAAISQKWRLDRLLQRKAREGVKIFVIVYRNIESAIPIDSEYTKWSLLDLHENITVQRSPNQFKKNQFFWAHHEKLVVVDNMMAFCGGVDLCFGRWDDPCHSLTDDKLTGFELDQGDVLRDSEHCQMWPGKDYSNPRVQDFYALDRPYEEMYDRTKVPRMPWHDISMQLVGQPARDIGRHFVQRWNYILRSRVPSRPTPVLLPPPEYDEGELGRLGMTGSCQIQILRSCSPWSMGTPNKTEHSIMNAYCSLIEHSDHFVYVENQFFISSCNVDGTQIHNKIGDALVERIIKAHENGEDWQACLVIPLMPGFQNSVDSQDGTSIRLIMQCQFRSICRGETSIFGRLQARGIEPEEYIRFYSLRQWGKIGPRKCLTTEQLYIHAKCMIVDDRSAIIGSANINERSMLGTRDSEVCAVVTDTKMIPGFMAGKPYLVGEFAHTLRKRLQREHLGVDVDALYRKEQSAAEREEQDVEMERIYRDQGDESATPLQNASMSPELQGQKLYPTLESADIKNEDRNTWAGSTPVNSSANLEAQLEGRVQSKRRSADMSHDLDVEGFGHDNMKALTDAGDFGLTDSFVDAHGRETLLRKDAPDVKPAETSFDPQESPRRSDSKDRQADVLLRPPYPTQRMDTARLGLPMRSQLPELPALDDTDIGGPPLMQSFSSGSGRTATHLMASLRRPEVHEDCMADPLATGFYDSIWHTIAENNTKLFRQVFRCMPDSEVLDYKTYEKFNDYNERFMSSQGLGNSKSANPKDASTTSGLPGSAGTDVASDTAEKGADGKQRGKSVLGGLAVKLKPSNKARTDEMDEKDNLEVPRAGSPGSPGSPGSGASSVPTTVPTPDMRPLDEKEATKFADAASRGDDASFTRQRTVAYSDLVSSPPETTATLSAQSEKPERTPSQRQRRRRGATKSSARTQGMEDVLSREEAEEVLKLVQGTLVLWPYDWLEKEERGGKWLFPVDQLAPWEIYD